MNIIYIHKYIYILYTTLALPIWQHPFTIDCKVLCRSKHDTRVGPLAGKHALNHGKEKANAGTTFNRLFHTTKTCTQPNPPPPASFCSSIFQYQANVFQKTKRIFSTVSFPSHVLGRVGLFLCACFRLCPAEAGFWSRSFSTQFLFQALILLAHALIFITQGREMNEEFALRCCHWVGSLGGLWPPLPKGTWKLGSNQEFDRFAVVFCWYFFCLLVAVIKKIIVGTDWWHSFFFLYTSL